MMRKFQLMSFSAATMLALAACQNQAAVAPTPAGAPAGAQAPAQPTRVVSANTVIAVDGALALETPLVSLSFGSSSKVAGVKAAPGQVVKMGDVLAELDKTDLNIALQKAQDALALQKAQIANSSAPATKADIDNAKTSLNAAYAAYTTLKNGPDAHTVEQARISWNQAKNSLASQQLQRDQTCHFVAGKTTDAEMAAQIAGDLDCKVSDRSVKSAEERLQITYQAYVDAQKPASDGDLAKSWSSVAQAQASLAKLQAGTSDTQKKIYELQLQQAQLNVDRAQRDLTNATLVAPCDCTVQDVGLVAGGTGTGAITLLDKTQIKFHSTNLNERDVATIKAGQTVVLRLKAFDKTLNGKVENVLPVSSGTASGAALFTAIIGVDKTDANLLPGMTGQAEISVPKATATTTTTTSSAQTRPGTTAKSITADGVITGSTPVLSVGFATSGLVKQVSVAAGQNVKTGDVLAKIVDTSLQDAVTDAQLSLDQVVASIAQQNAPPSKEDVAAAQAALNAAYQSYKTTKTGTTQSQIDSAKVNVDAAWTSYLNAQTNRDVHCGTAAGTETTDCKMQEISYGNAFESWVAARDNYMKALEPVAASTLSSAYGQVQSAQSKLDSLKNSVTDTQRKVSDIQLAQAQSNLARAKDNLAKATLTSPCDCVVQSVSAVVGANAPSAAFTLVNLGRMQFKTTNLTEVDVASIKVGATATIRLKAHSDVFAGKVAAVLSNSSGTQSGTAIYTVLIDLDKTNALLLPGMTGQASISQ